MYKQILDNNAKKVFERLREAEKQARIAERNVMIFSDEKVIKDFNND